MNRKAEYHPEWKSDCGRWNYDCPLVSLDSRYWPGDDISGPSAKVCISIGDLINGPFEDLACAEFKGNTEEQVKAQVERWAEKAIARVESAIRKEFSK